MAIGDLNNVYARIKSYIPPWFTDNIPVLSPIIYGLASAYQFIYSFYAYAVLQTRIATATDENLDIISADFFGFNLPRNIGESDSDFRARIIMSLFQERATKTAMINVITRLTGVAPIIFEPYRALDTGVYGGPYIGYGQGGGWGSAYRTAQFLMIADIATNNIPIGNLYAAVNLTRAAGVTAWVATTSYEPPDLLGVNFVLGSSILG